MHGRPTLPMMMSLLRIFIRIMGSKLFFAYLGDGELVTWNKLQNINVRLEYQYTLSEKWSIGAGWNFSFIHATDPLPLTSVQHHFNLMISLQLQRNSR